ncbi:hypothetical protein TIFTF001_044194 [Ficus carica]|uniref:Uncharacterized protein n=1 Tax=Ficus carica TaxID=3494 RepID=A0AA88CS51_FICCA|nr:hypothetical protein TIFTF001_044194 [Ficus carica]
MHRAKGFIELEEENERFECDLARTREEIAKALVEVDCSSEAPRLRHVAEEVTKKSIQSMTKYCEFHRDHGHHTIDCRKLRAEVVELLNKGHLREFLSEKGRETYGLGNESKERKIVQQIEETPSPPPI